MGSAVAGLLRDAGHTVWCARRKSGGGAPGTRPVVLDVGVPASLWSIPQDLDWVVYAVSAGSQTREAYRRAYCDGPVTTLEALEQTSPGLRRFLLVSSTVVYDQRSGEEVDETSPATGTRSNADLVLAGENAVRSMAGGIVIRLGGIYGPGRTSLVQRVARGEAPCFKGPPEYTNRIHREDAARAIVHLLSLPDADSMYLGVDSEPAPRCEVLRWLAARLDAPEPPVLDPAEDSRSRRPGSKRCSNRRLLDSGFQFTYPNYRVGYEAILSEGGER